MNGAVSTSLGLAWALAERLTKDAKESVMSRNATDSMSRKMTWSS